MSNTYLFPTDGSENSDRAVKYLNEYVKSGDRVIVVHVISDPVLMDWELDFDPIDFEGKLRQAGENLLVDTAEKLQGEDVEVETELLSGDPGEEITKFARENDVDSIVMGRQGKGAVSEILLGSVSHYVTHHSKTPVVVIPNPDNS